MFGSMLRWRSTRIIVSTSLCLFGISALAASPAAGNDTPGSLSLYFPWTPTGSMIVDQTGFTDQGPFYGSITIHNLETESVSLRYMITGEGDDISDESSYSSTLMPPQGGRTFTMQQFVIETGFEGDATGVVMYGVKSAGGGPARISGVQLQAAAVPIDVDSKTSDAFLTVGGYSGLRSTQLGGESDIHFPIVQTNSNWNTLIRATSFMSDTDQDIELTLRDAGGDGEQQFTQPAAPGVPVTFDLLALGVDPEWVGAATLSGSGSFGAVAERIKSETSMLMINTARPMDASSTEQYFPLVLRDWFDWNTGISLLNLSDAENDVVVDFYAMDGELAASEPITLPPSGMNFIYMPSGDGEPFVGSAVVTSEAGVLGAIDEVKYLGDPADGAGHAMSYMLERELATLGETISMPLYQKGDPESGLGDTSGIQAFNPMDVPVEIEIQFHDQSGMMVAEGLFTLDPKQGETFYAMDFPGIPDGLTGTAFIQVMSAAGGVTGISNHVNYAVQYDGSAAFNMMVVGDSAESPGPIDPPGDLITP